MPNVTVTDVNDGTIYIIPKNDINAVYEQTEFRRVLLYNGTEIDVSESFATLNSDVGGQPIT